MLATLQCLGGKKVLVRIQIFQGFIVKYMASQNLPSEHFHGTSYSNNGDFKTNWLQYFDVCCNTNGKMFPQMYAPVTNVPQGQAKNLKVKQLMWFCCMRLAENRKQS